MTPKSPISSLAIIPKGKYADYVAALGPAPAGFRYLKVGEKFVKGKDYVLANGRSWDNTISAGDGPYAARRAPFASYSIVCDSNWPCITPVKRDSKGRFASQKAVDEKLKTVHGVVLEDLKRVIDGDKEGLYNAFSWASTEQGHSYWSARRKGDAAITASDLDYLKRLYALKGGKLEPEAQKVGPHDTRLQALTRAYEALGKEIAALKAELG